MSGERDFRRLLLYTFYALAACVAAVVCCYAWVDRPVAFYVHDHEINRIAVFKALTFPPPIVQEYSPLILVLLMFRRGWKPLADWQRTLLVACLSLIVAYQFRGSLGSLFGRYWPETWHDDNLSLIGTGTYGFKWFPTPNDIGSFPSGHATRILSFSGVWWLAAPRTRLLWILICPPLLVSLVAMNYHFVSDVIAGGVIGAIVAVYAVYLAGLTPAARTSGSMSPR